MIESLPQDFLMLTHKISVERGFRCASYKEKCLRRRIAVRMRARGVHTYAEYASVLDGDASEYERLLDVLTINVTKLFRNWDVYASIAANVVPELWARGASPIRVWSAGCSSGDEAYSLAILFHQLAATHRYPLAPGRVRILGTDIDRQCLDAAARGEFTEGDFADTPAALRETYFRATAPFAVSPVIRPLVRFERRDLLTDDAPPGLHDLIVCRNVMIYFDRDSQEMIFEKFYNALAPDGILVLGKVETLLGRPRSRFAAIDARERIFRRV